MLRNNAALKRKAHIRHQHSWWMEIAWHLGRKAFFKGAPLRAWAKFNAVHLRESRVAERAMYQPVRFWDGAAKRWVSRRIPPSLPPAEPALSEAEGAGAQRSGAPLKNALMWSVSPGAHSRPQRTCAISSARFAGQSP